MYFYRVKLLLKCGWSGWFSCSEYEAEIYQRKGPEIQVRFEPADEMKD